MKNKLVIALFLTALSGNAFSADKKVSALTEGGALRGGDIVHAVRSGSSYKTSYFGGSPVSGATAIYPMLDGSGTTVTDISGNGNHATFCATGPTWTTYGLSFVSASANCVSTPLTTFRTALFHICPLTAGTSGLYGSWPTILATPVGSSGGIHLKVGSSFGSVNADGSIHPATMVSGPSAAVKSISKVASSPDTPCVVLGLSIDTQDRLYTNGRELSYTSTGTSLASITAPAPGYYIGGNTQATNWSFAGTVQWAEFYPTVLSAADILKQTNYINDVVNARTGLRKDTGKGVASSLYPSLICDGDSLTSASGGTVWCSSTYTSATTTYSYSVNATFGRYAQAEAQFVKATGIPSINPLFSTNKCHVWIGTNDVSGDESEAYRPAATTWKHIVSIGKQYKDAGCMPIVATMISRNGDDDRKNELNAVIRSNWKNAGFVALNDLAAIPNLGADAAYSSSCFGGDGIHLVSTGTSCYDGRSGYATVGWNVGRVINYLDGATESSPVVTAVTDYDQAIADNFIQHTPTAAATNTLPDCTGLTGLSRTIVNGSPTYDITVDTSAGQTITGSATIAANTTGRFVCQLISPTTGGNYWLRVQ